MKPFFSFVFMAGCTFCCSMHAVSHPRIHECLVLVQYSCRHCGTHFSLAAGSASNNQEIYPIDSINMDRVILDCLQQGLLLWSHVLSLEALSRSVLDKCTVLEKNIMYWSVLDQFTLL